MVRPLLIRSLMLHGYHAARRYWPAQDTLVHVNLAQLEDVPLPPGGEVLEVLGARSYASIEEVAAQGYISVRRPGELAPDPADRFGHLVALRAELERPDVATTIEIEAEPEAAAPPPASSSAKPARAAKRTAGQK